MEAVVRRELFGPSANEPPRGKPLDCSTGNHRFDTREDSSGLWHDGGTGQEILTGGDPLHRYGTGALLDGATGHATGIVHTTLPPSDHDHRPHVGVHAVRATVVDG